MPLAPVTPPTLLTDRVFETIRDAIMAGELAAGTQLKVRDLAAQVGTSVMPVREAIRRLEESGLATREPHRGAVVRTLTMRELLDTYQVRMLLEVEAARLGAEHISSRECASLRKLARNLAARAKEGDVVAALDADEALLGTIYRAADNPVLVESISSLWRRCRPYKILGARRAFTSHDELLWSFQPLLVEAVCANDAAAAAQITKDSMNSALERIRSTFAQTAPNN